MLLIAVVSSEACGAIIAGAICWASDQIRRMRISNDDHARRLGQIHTKPRYLESRAMRNRYEPHECIRLIQTVLEQWQPDRDMYYASRLGRGV